MSELTQASTGIAVIYSDPLATQADIARLETKIDRLLAVLDPPTPSRIVEFNIDGTAIATAILPHITEAARKAKP